MSIQRITFSGPGLHPKYNPVPIQGKADCHHMLDGSSGLESNDVVIYTCTRCGAYQSFREWDGPAVWPEVVKSK